MHQKSLVAWLRQDPPAGEFTALPRPPSWILGVETREGRGERQDMMG